MHSINNIINTEKLNADDKDTYLCTQDMTEAIQNEHPEKLRSKQNVFGCFKFPGNKEELIVCLPTEFS